MLWIVEEGSRRCARVSHETVNRLPELETTEPSWKREPGQEEGGGRCWREGETGTKQRRVEGGGGGGLLVLCQQRKKRGKKEERSSERAGLFPHAGVVGSRDNVNFSHNCVSCVHVCGWLELMCTRVCESLKRVSKRMHRHSLDKKKEKHIGELVRVFLGIKPLPVIKPLLIRNKEWKYSNKWKCWNGFHSCWNRVKVKGRAWKSAGPKAKTLCMYMYECCWNPSTNMPAPHWPK